MKVQFRFCFISIVMMMSSAADEVKKILTGVVGGNVTFPDPLLEFGFLLKGDPVSIALVKDGKLQFVEEIYTNKLHWNKNSGLFTITELQKNDSGIYKIDSKTGKVLSASYNLTVCDPAAPPSVETQTVTSDLCLLTCSVDKPATLLWIRDVEIQNQSRSAVSLTVTVHKEDRASSYRCVAANPAENKTVDVDVTTSCWLDQTGSGANRTHYWTVTLVLVVLLLLVVPLICIKLKLLEKNICRQKQDSRNDCHYEEVEFINQSHQVETFAASSESSDLPSSTVYAKLNLPAEVS